MATFQSQINILAAGQHNLHKKIEEITDLHLVATYDSLTTIIKDDKDGESNEEIKIEGLGYQSFDCILTVNGSDLHFMDYKGLCEDFTISSGLTNPKTIEKISIDNSTTSEDTASLDETGKTLNLLSKTFENKAEVYDFPSIIVIGKPLNEGKTVTEGV